MVRLDRNDDVLIATSSKTIVWQGEQPIRLFRWTLWRQVRRTFVLHDLPLGELIALERALDVITHIDLAGCVELLAGPIAARAPRAVQQAILEAHYEVRYPSPKAKATERPSATAPSSVASSSTTPSPPSTSSPA